jgi:cytochrome c553
VKILAGLLGIAAATVLGALAFAWSGLGDIAASKGHWPFVERFLDFGMRHAVKRHASGIEVPKLDDPNMIRLGAAHFHRGCAFCHGAPRIPVSPIAEYYAGLAPPQFHSGASDQSLVERGRKLATEGLPKAGVAPCSACHNSIGSFPRLAGQYAAYMAGQLRHWKAGIGPSADSGAVMMPIAQGLSDEDIDAVASYFAALPPPSGGGH